MQFTELSTRRANLRLAGSLAVLAFAGMADLALAQTATDRAADRAASSAKEGAGPGGLEDTIVVTGTRRTDRTVTESAVPVDVFSAGDIKVQASPQLQTILRNLVPSFNQQRNLLGDGSAFIRPPSLRGLPADQVLVLINGKRMHRSALVQVTGGALNAGAQGPDLSQISAGAVGRVEVLRDGAAAQYGSDAIAGVINIGLKTNDSGFEMQGRYGQTYMGDGQDTQIWANWGTKLGDGGFFNVTGEFIDQNIWDRAVQRPEAAALQALGFQVRNPVNRLGQPENRAYRGAVNSMIPVGDKGEVYLFGNYGWQKQGNDFNYRRPVGVTVTPIPGQPGTATQGKSINTTYLDRLPNGNWDANGRTFEASQFFPNGFTPFFEATNEDVAGVVGYRNETEGGLRYDLSVGSGMNRVRYFMSETLNPSLGPQSPQSFYLGALTQRETNLNLDVSYPVEVGFASPLNIAGGLEFRRESYAVGLGQRESWVAGQYAAQTVQRTDGTTFLSTKPVGSNGFPGFGPDSVIEGGRNSVSAYLDLEADITQAFTLGVATRYDRFTDFGSTFNGKISARWALNEIIALRAAGSTGFRAPTPGQQLTSNVQTAFPGGSPVPLSVATARPDSTVGLYYGSGALRPEKSVSFSGGIVLTPGGGFNVSLDAYTINVRDRIGITGQFVVTAADQQALFALGVPTALDLGRVNYFTNGFRTKTQGVDLVITHKGESDAGTFNSSLAVNYNRTRVTERRTISLADIRPGDTRTLALIDDVRKGNIEDQVPRWRAILATSWSKGIFDATARVNYSGSFSAWLDPTTSNPAPNVRSFGARATVDLEVGITLEETYRLAIGGENIFNAYPERETRNIFPSTGGAANGSRWPDASPIGYMGGFWYVRASAKF
ncbi:TonB-dependent receptor domain-containing protein [Sandarakinorhabdus sp.]|uniref:TonB-dependent receptor plug domain-containing protein n=1 Tax=Sandarakinorhabdus sp. TaxID=1916663 RepID=UPI00286D8C04|nr:TonB-dependent receptor [Sandarakinorhabdus sp.]